MSGGKLVLCITAGVILGGGILIGGVVLVNASERARRERDAVAEARARTNIAQAQQGCRVLALDLESWQMFAHRQPSPETWQRDVAAWQAKLDGKSWTGPDPWGRAYRLVGAGKSWRVVCDGPDGLAETADDLAAEVRQ